MLPEISRRCLSCGAAVRAGARFCPQCGKEMGAAPAEQAEEVGGAGEASEVSEASEVNEAARPRPTPPPTPPTPPPAPRTPAAPRTPVPTTRESQALFEAPPTKEFEAFSEGIGLTPTREVAREAAREEAGAAVPEVGGEVGTGATEAGAPEAGEAGRVARVREGTRARVGRMREEALVVLEEAPDDSGMRFVVMAVAAFLLFVVLLFLSTTVLR